MSGVKISFKTKHKKALELTNNLRSYLYEEEFGEMKDCSLVQKSALRSAVAVLDTIAKAGK